VNVRGHSKGLMELWKLIEAVSGKTDCCLDGKIGAVIWPRHPAGNAAEGLATFEGPAAFEALSLVVTERSPKGWRAVFDLADEYDSSPTQIICEVEADIDEDSTPSWFLQCFKGPEEEPASATTIPSPWQATL